METGGKRTAKAAITELLMIRGLPGAVILGVFGTNSVGAESPDMKQTRVDFERLAAQLPYLSLNSVLYDRPDHLFQVAHNKREEHFRILRKARDGTYPKEALLDLLAHGDPKVRTLAAVALFDREDPSVLPALVELCADGAASFDGYDELSVPSWIHQTGIGLSPLRQTVGDIAKRMVGFYMVQSGYYYGVAYGTQTGFAQYWDDRKNRSHCAGWFAVQLARASQSTSPTRKNCIDRIRAVRKRIDELPADERTWVLLWLKGESGSDALVSDEELIQMCKGLGPDKLLLMLQHSIPSGDPDLQPRNKNNWPYKRMVTFVLRHAEGLLRKSDGDALLACERWQRDYREHGISDPTITAWWAVAAARLQPEKASPILHAALKRFQGEYDADERSSLCVALWQLAGRAEGKFLVDWLYDEEPERGAFPNCRSAFIESAGKDRNGREIVGWIIQDRRLDSIDWQSLVRLVRVVNGWVKTPIISEQEIQNTRHPVGKGHFYWSLTEAEEKYPKETEELRGRLAEWSKRLRASVPEWLHSR